MISALCHTAARELGIETEWHQNLLDRKECPGCGSKVPGRAARCPNCKWILNPDAIREQNQLEGQLAANPLVAAGPAVGATASQARRQRGR